MNKSMRKSWVFAGALAVFVLSAYGIVSWQSGASESVPSRPSLVRRPPAVDPQGDSRSFGVYTFGGEFDEDRMTELPADQPYRRVFALTHYAPFPRDYVLVALVNLKQQTFWVDGAPRRHHVFHTEPGQAVEIPIQMHLEPGWNDVTLLVFKDPGVTVSDPEVRKGLEGVAADFRQVVQVGTTDRDAPAWAPVPPQSARPQSVLPDLNVSQTPDEVRYWLWAEAAAGTQLPVYLQVGNGGSDPSRFALVGFMDWEQVPLTGAAVPLLGELPPGHLGTWNVNLKVPVQPGVHEFQAALIPSPFESTRVGSPAPVGSFRLGIHVRGPDG